MYRRFDARKMRLSHKNTVPTLKHGGGLMFQGCFSSRRTRQIICNKRNNELGDYLKILDENLQLSMQNLDRGWQFIFQQNDIPNICLNQ